MREVLIHVNHVNSYDHNCKLVLDRLNNDTSFRITPKGCNVDPALTAGRKVIYAALPTAQVVTFYSGLLRAMTEDQTVAVLAHELGHYYHGHAYAPVGRYQYLYHLTADNPPTAPSDSADLQQISADLEQANAEFMQATMKFASTAAGVPANLYQKIDPSQRFNTAMFRPIWMLVQEASFKCTDTTHCACATAVSSAAIPLARFTSTPEGIVGPLTPEEKAAYLVFESAAASCLQGIPINSSGDQQSISPAKVFAAFTGMPSSPYALELGYGLPLTSRYLKDLPPAGTLGDYLKQASAYLDGHYPAYDANVAAAYPGMRSTLEHQAGELESSLNRLSAMDARLRQEQLGYFTLEVEADELAAEWLSYLGFDPHAGSDAMLQFLYQEGKYDSASVLKCMKQHASGWIDSNGDPILVPWGYIEDLHPASCFRIRNFEKEIIAHQYPIPTVSPTATLLPAWNDLLASIGGPNPIPAPKPTAPQAATTPPSGRSWQPLWHCRYAPF